MAQRGNKRQPVYSADTLALRYLAGLVLFGVMYMLFRMAMKYYRSTGS